MKMKSKMTVLLASATLGIGFLAGNVTAERQPNMLKAHELLGQAKTALQNATADKGGHRAKAVDLVNQAIAEVKAGIDYDAKK